MTPVGPKTQRLSQIAVPAQHAAEYQDDMDTEIAVARRETGHQQVRPLWRPPGRAKRSRIFFVLLSLWTVLYGFIGASSVASFLELSQQVPHSNPPADFFLTTPVRQQPRPAITAAGFGFIAMFIIAGWSPIGLPLLIAAVATLPEPE